jgi:hypothetical protein
MSSVKDKFVFHHIPKCGGNSTLNILDSWFDLVFDYNIKKDKFKLDELTPSQCLCGHWELPNNHMHKRHPKIIREINYKVFTFVRDPLSIRLSLFRYEHEKGRCHFKSFEDDLRERKNWFSKRFPANEFNYKMVIDRYFFIGILEEFQLSLDILAYKLRRPKKTAKLINFTAQKNTVGFSNLSSDIVSKFKHENALDYHIYDYCKQKYNDTKDKVARETNNFSF